MPVAKSVLLFLLAGLCEVGGGYLVWQWWRKGRHWMFGAAGAVALLCTALFLPTSPPRLAECTRPMADGSLCSRSSGDGWWTASSRTAMTLSEEWFAWRELPSSCTRPGKRRRTA